MPNIKKQYLTLYYGSNETPSRTYIEVYRDLDGYSSTSNSDVTNYMAANRNDFSNFSRYGIVKQYSAYQLIANTGSGNWEKISNNYAKFPVGTRMSPGLSLSHENGVYYNALGLGSNYMNFPYIVDNIPVSPGASKLDGTAFELGISHPFDYYFSSDIYSPGMVLLVPNNRYTPSTYAVMIVNDSGNIVVGGYYSGHSITISDNPPEYPEYSELVSEPYKPGGPSVPAGGGGNFGNDRESEDLTPLIPNGSSENDLVDAGIFTRYLVNNAQLKEFAKWLFVDNWGEALWRELTIATFGNIYDSLISVMSYPFAVGQLPGITTVAGNIYLGSLNSGAPSSGILAKSFSQIDWGSISITEYWGNFLDYAPHTKIQLFLPWGTGFVDIDPNEVMNGTLQVKTNIELSKGTCVHIVSNGGGAILGTYNGFCGSQYPITAVDTSGKAIGAAIAGVSLAVAGASGAIAKEAGERGLHALQVASSTKNAGYPELPHLRMAGLNELHREATYNAMSAGAAKVAAKSSLAAARIPATFNRNGSFASNAAGMMPQKPFIVMTWPDQSVPEQYGSHVGYPSNIYISLGRLRGYTEVGAIHLEGINCTEHEREELMSLLQGGVIL